MNYLIKRNTITGVNVVVNVKILKNITEKTNRKTIMNKFRDLVFVLAEISPYSLDLTSSGYYLFLK